APAARRARKILNAGGIGRLLSTSMYVPSPAFGPRAPAHSAWLMDPASGGSLTTILGGHSIDLARFLLGDICELSAWGTIMFAEVELVDPPGYALRQTPDRLLIQL